MLPQNLKCLCHRTWPSCAARLLGRSWGELQSPQPPKGGVFEVQGGKLYDQSLLSDVLSFGEDLGEVSSAEDLGGALQLVVGIFTTPPADRLPALSGNTHGM